MIKTRTHVLWHMSSQIWDILLPYLWRRIIRRRKNITCAKTYIKSQSHFTKNPWSPLYAHILALITHITSLSPARWRGANEREKKSEMRWPRRGNKGWGEFVRDRQLSTPSQFLAFPLNVMCRLNNVMSKYIVMYVLLVHDDTAS